MKQGKIFSAIFSLISIILFGTMCATVAYYYCRLYYAGIYAGGSAPPSVAFVLSVPFAIGIIISTTFSWFFYKKRNK